MSDLEPNDVVERELALRSEMPFVQTEAQLHQLLAIARHVDFHRGDHLFEAGAQIASIYLITAGDVELVAEGSPSWRFNGSGGVGFLDLMMMRPHSRTAIARSDVRTLEIDAADYREYMQDHSDVGHQVLSMLSSNLFDEMLAAHDRAALLHRPPDVDLLPGSEDPTLVDRLLLLSRVPAFSRATVQALANLAQHARVVRFAAGDVIATAGARSEVLSVLVHGQVELTKPGTPLSALRGPVDLVCDIAELSTVPRYLAARATQDSVVLQIDREELLDRLDEHFELTQSLFAHVASQRELFNNSAAAAGIDL